MNSVTLIGRVADPPELKVAESGEEVCSIRLAVPRVARGGTREPGVVYVDVTTRGWQAREIWTQVHVGGRIGVAGRIELHEWIAPEGGRRTRYEVHADQLELLDPPPPRPPEPDPEPDGAGGADGAGDPEDGDGPEAAEDGEGPEGADGPEGAENGEGPEDADGPEAAKDADGPEAAGDREGEGGTDRPDAAAGPPDGDDRTGSPGGDGP